MPRRNHEFKPKENLVKRSKLNIESHVEIIRTKLKNWLDAKNPMRLKRNYILVDGLIKMRCVKCLNYYERTPEFFSFDQRDDYFKTCNPGFENFHNSMSTPCKICFNTSYQKKNATRDGFINILLVKYPKLTKDWFENTLKSQEFCGGLLQTN